MVTQKLIHSLAVMSLLLGIALSSACQTPAKPSFEHNISSLERALIESINANGPGERYVINRVNVSEEVVDRYTISLISGESYSAISESGSGRVGAGSVVQFCGWGEFLGISVFTNSPYLCKRGDGLVFGVTRYGWVHLYGTGEISGTRISLQKPN